MEPMTLGVEEEFLVVDAATGRARAPLRISSCPRARDVLGEEVAPELNLCQIEVGTPVCARTSTRCAPIWPGCARACTIRAERLGVAVAATATHPFSSWQHQQVDLSNERYSRMDDTYQIVARQQVICGCHVHVGVDDGDLAIGGDEPGAAVAAGAAGPVGQLAVLAGARHRATPATACRCGSAGRRRACRPDLPSRHHYDELVRELQEIEAIEDATFLYWYARPVGPLPDAGVPGVRRVPRRRAHGHARRADPGAGVDQGPGGGRGPPVGHAAPAR